MHNNRQKEKKGLIPYGLIPYGLIPYGLIPYGGDAVWDKRCRGY
jgi:hypothetical protein